MKYRRKWLALALSVLMICGIGAAVVYAAADAGGDNTAPAGSDSTGFTDVPVGAWYADEVKWCQENGIMSGTSETEATFAPDVKIKRRVGSICWIFYSASWPGRKSCVKADKLRSKAKEQIKGQPVLGTGCLNLAYPPVFRDGRRYARAA